jgi:chromosome condensin MukBEF ATPase and DNA-binding subunit MukB
MLTPRQRSIKLNQAIDLMEQADALIQQALGACDECEELHNRIQAVADDVLGQVIFMNAE